MIDFSAIDQPRVIVVDGTAGSGKGTVSNRLAQALGWHYLDSGLLYRGLALLYAWEIIGNKVARIELNKLELADLDSYYNDFINHESIHYQSELALNLDLKIINGLVYLRDQQAKWQEVTNIIRSESCGNLASKLAILPKVRSDLLAKQRAYLQLPGLIADGRDLGTVVFPEASLKFFLDADPMIRASRRHIQLKEAGVNDNLCNRIEELSARDKRDSNRIVAPMQPAADAIHINTTYMTIEEVFVSIMNKIKLINLR